ncbi:hypothetical protein Pcinc_041781 [Petrolisthes cinctipes]|uniref:Uncharacterized protein n=1 Tax=Petrolisthes cinctipes TaxID=88211 RepID=A0AAE1BK26_PETCI|nr:hypothetical protein Pcinc_041781 [Petrolisthes cinctipes]
MKLEVVRCTQAGHGGRDGKKHPTSHTATSQEITFSFSRSSSIFWPALLLSSSPLRICWTDQETVEVGRNPAYLGQRTD